MTSGTIRLPGFEELDLTATLTSGQLFRWRRDSDGAWHGFVGESSLRLSQSESGEMLFWEAASERAVRDFLRLDDLTLANLAEEWSANDAPFAEAWALQPGVRILRQDPHECFFSFLCASVAPISRISSMLRSIAPIGEPFPSLEALGTLSEARLRALGLGFRAPRVVAAARSRATDGLLEKRGAPLPELETLLTRNVGVGRKIADCIALFSLDADAAVPVDTHIWQLARAHYAPHLANKALTAKTYQQVLNVFSDRFGERAGESGQVLQIVAVSAFAAVLPTYAQ